MSTVFSRRLKDTKMADSRQFYLQRIQGRRWALNRAFDPTEIDVVHETKRKSAYYLHPMKMILTLPGPGFGICF